MTNAEKKVAEIVSVELFKNMVNSLDRQLRSNTLKNSLFYNSKEINESLCTDFAQLVEVLQNVVDSRWIGYYEISGFQALSLEDFDSCVSHNLSLVANCKKLIKFIG